MRTLSKWIALGALALAVSAARAPAQDPKAAKLEDDWRASSAAWRLEGGELRAKGAGFLEYARPLAGDFRLGFRAETSEKANVEVKLTDAKGERALMTFAFLGRYHPHPAVNGVKCAILREDRFVNVSPKMWIFPGRTFEFEVRRSRNQWQMFLDGELGPFFVDESPPAGLEKFLLRIELAQDADGAARVRDVALTFQKK